MNPETNMFERLTAKEEMESLRDKMSKMRSEINGPDHTEPVLLRPDGTPVPKHWTQFKVDERVVIKGYTFKVAHIGESHILFEPVGPLIVGE